MELKEEQIKRAIKTFEGARVIVANRDFDEFQDAIITAINALSLIKKLTAENERLRRLRTIDDRYKFCNLIGDTLVYNKTLEDYNRFRADFRAYTVHEFAERLKKRFKFLHGVIDQVEKEMTEK